MRTVPRRYDFLRRHPLQMRLQLSQRFSSEEWYSVLDLNQ